MGSGIPKKGLLFGTSGKSDNGKAIGMFGEGLKMAMLVLAREKRNPKFETVGFSASACLLHNNEFDTDLLTIFVEENTRTKGTIFTFDGTQKEINEIKQKFITLSNEFKKVDGEEELYLPGGYLFVNGVKVCKLNDASYTYNICGAKGKSLLGRDRKTPDMYGVKDICSNILGNTSSKDVIKTILSSTWNKFELCLGSNYWKINSRRKKTWKNVAMEVYPKSCLPVGNTETNLVAKDNGYKVLHQLPSEIISILQAIGFPTASMAAGEVKGQDEIRVIKDSELSANGKKRLEMARMIVEELYGSSIAKKLYAGENFTDPDGGITLGIYSPMLDKCLILRSVVESSPLYKLLGTAVHEACHKSTSTKDRTRDFENELTDCIGKLAEKFLS